MNNQTSNQQLINIVPSFWANTQSSEDWQLLEQATEIQLAMFWDCVAYESTVFLMDIYPEIVDVTF